MAAGPGPFYLVPPCRLAQPLPILMIFFLPISAALRFNNVTRIGYDLDLTGISKHFQTDSGGYYLSLVVGGMAKVFADGAVMGLAVFFDIAEYRDRPSAGAVRAVPKGASIADYRD